MQPRHPSLAVVGAHSRGALPGDYIFSQCPDAKPVWVLQERVLEDLGKRLAVPLRSVWVTDACSGAPSTGEGSLSAAGSPVWHGERGGLACVGAAAGPAPAAKPVLSNSCSQGRSVHAGSAEGCAEGAAHLPTPATSGQNPPAGGNAQPGTWGLAKDLLRRSRAMASQWPKAALYERCPALPDKDTQPLAALHL